MGFNNVDPYSEIFKRNMCIRKLSILSQNDEWLN